MSMQGRWDGDWSGDWFGADEEAPASQAGYRSLLAFWVGGASAPPAPATQAGFRSLVAPWLGGASAPTVPATQAGYRSMLAFWAGGAAQGAIVTPPTPPPAPARDGVPGEFPSRFEARRHRIFVASILSAESVGKPVVVNRTRRARDDEFLLF